WRRISSSARAIRPVAVSTPVCDALRLLYPSRAHCPQPVKNSPAHSACLVMGKLRTMKVLTVTRQVVLGVAAGALVAGALAASSAAPSRSTTEVPTPTATPSADTVRREKIANTLATLPLSF